MMDIATIQSRIDAMPARMSAKGLAQPSAMLWMEGNVEPRVFLSWEDTSKPKHAYRTASQYFRGGTVAEELDAADAWIAALPSPEETKLRNFMNALGSVIDLGREQGIEVGFVNPLVETMKKLSENIITYQPTVAE